MRDATTVPDLQIDAAVGGVNGVSDFTPARYLGLVIDAGGVQDTGTVRAHGVALGHDQTG